MKWRTVWTFLFVMLIFSIVGGFGLGFYLQKEVPHSSNEVDTSVKDPAPLIGANGLPMTPEPPQPLPTGGFDKAGEDTTTQVNWKIDPNNRTKNDATELSSAQVEYQVVTGETQGALQNGLVISKDDIGSVGINEDAPEWLKTLQGLMHICRQMRFKDRAPCIHQARVQYCTPNNGWGAYPECPASDAPPGTPINTPDQDGNSSGGGSSGGSSGSSGSSSGSNGSGSSGSSGSSSSGGSQ